MFTEVPNLFRPAIQLTGTFFIHDSITIWWHTKPLIGRIGDGLCWLCFIYPSVAFELWQNIACSMISSICEKKNLFDLYAADASESFDLSVCMYTLYVCICMWIGSMIIFTASNGPMLPKIYLYLHIIRCPEGIEYSRCYIFYIQLGQWCIQC